MSAESDNIGLSWTDAVRANERLEQALEASDTAVWHTDLTTGHVYLSRNWALMLGGEPGATVTTIDALKQIVHPDDVEGLLRLQAEAVKGSTQNYAAEHRVRMRSGAWKWILSRGRVTARDPLAGRATQMSGTNVDITAQKRLEEQIKGSREERQRILDAVPAEIAYIARSEHIAFANRAYLVGRGLAEAQVVGRLLREVIDERSYAVVRPQLERALGGHAVEFQIDDAPRAGAARQLFVRYVPDLEARGRVRGVFHHAVDVTQQSHAEMQLRSAKLAAERANQAKSEFLASMSHELRTPLGTILGFGQLLEEDAASLPDDLHRQWVASIVRSGWHLLGLVNEVLDLARIEAGRVELAIEAVALEDLIDECHREVSPIATKRQISLNVECPATLNVRADRMRLRQVLLNLLSNAVKYNTERGSVRVTARAAGKRARIEVSDTGEGIGPERIGELFEPFRRLGAERSKVEGFGLGLSITRRLVEMMRGAIGVRSQPGEGSTFWVELPLAPAGDARAADGGASADAGMWLEGVAATVLCVEDDPANQRLVQAVFSRWRRMRLLLAQDGRQGLELALSGRPDLILLDIDLPSMDGYEIMRELRAHEHTRNIPIIGLSARAMLPDIERANGASFHAYLTKPYQLRELQERIESALASIGIRP